MKKIILILFLFSLVACHHNRVKLEKEGGGTKGEVKMLYHKYWVGGMFPRKIEIDGTQLCPSGIAEIDQYYRWQDAVLTQLTFGIYVPRTMKITCN
ncbi:MAG TPA: hypothetical protein PK079_22185 [Leptospiraceae bacterium]|nr:hypothetical protein [Leptospiraceae bacterium]HMW08325.1 hypothetical protein [Leptospiraceae bacterium]HMX35473.1 hypothetical protein [Leptospiraceae bacterium]HMY34432.1 hypothetical protein [Leptospiraceae bacterium]HMZ66890.1 hypothetical protein [Leptospiraceae bacterium]